MAGGTELTPVGKGVGSFGRLEEVATGETAFGVGVNICRVRSQAPEAQYRPLSFSARQL
jgi:hypothetical protein